MDQICSYEGCKGSPKNLSSHNASPIFCDYHLDLHQTNPDLHPKPAILNLEQSKISNLLSKEMIKLSSTVAQVVMTGKDMFNEVCMKIVEITDDLTKRQQSLIEMANNQSTVPEDSVKELTNIQIKFKKKEDFRKMIDQHFSQQESTFDFSIFSKDFQDIIFYLQHSNELLENVRSQTEEDKENTKEVLEKMKKFENSSYENTASFEKRIKQLEELSKKQEKAFSTKSKTKKIKYRLRALENQIESQEKMLEEVNLKFENISQSIQQHILNLSENEKNSRKFEKKAEKEINFKFSQIFLSFEKEREKLNDLMEEYKNFTCEQILKNNEEVGLVYQRKFEENDERFKEFCDRVSSDLKNLELKYDGLDEQISFCFTQRLSLEIENIMNQKQEEKLRVENEKEKRGANNLDFDSKNLEEKIQFYLSLKLGKSDDWPRRYPKDIKEIKITNNRSFMFVCNQYKGTL